MYLLILFIYLKYLLNSTSTFINSILLSKNHLSGQYPWHLTYLLPGLLNKFIFELSWLENPANTYMRHTEPQTAVSTILGHISSAYRDLHDWRSNQQPQNAEAETLPLGYQFISHVSDTELTSHGDNARPLSLMCLEGTYSLQRTRSPPRLRLPKWVLWIHITLTSWTGNRIIYIYLFNTPTFFTKVFS